MGVFYGSMDEGNKGRRAERRTEGQGKECRRDEGGENVKMERQEVTDWCEC